MRKSCNVPHCKRPIWIQFKVQVYHPNSDQTSTQTWPLCRAHFCEFLSQLGEGWVAVYQQKTSAQVIGFFLPMLGYFETPHRSLADHYYVFDQRNSRVHETGNNLQELQQKYKTNTDMVFFNQHDEILPKAK